MKSVERRLVKQGRDALTVTLPAGWLRKKGLKQGDSVHLEEKSTEIIVRSRPGSDYKEVMIDVRGADRSMIWHAVIGKYILGFDRIVIMHDKPTVTREFSKMLLGMIVEEHSGLKTILKSIISTPEQDINTIMRRMLHMLLRLAQILEDFSQGNAQFQDMKEQEYLLDTNVYYCMRYINKYNLRQDSFKHFLFCSTLEAAADFVTLLAKSNVDTATAKLVNSGIGNFVKDVFSGNLKKTHADLKAFMGSIPQKAYVHAIAYSVAETLYNNIGFISEQSRA